MTYAGIELTEINMPQTLIKFLTTKLRASSSKNVTKTRLLAMLLAHEGFNVTFAGSRLRIKFDDNVKFATESLHS
jgi:predicted sulfurtransferase